MATAGPYKRLNSKLIAKEHKLTLLHVFLLLHLICFLGRQLHTHTHIYIYIYILALYIGVHFWGRLVQPTHYDNSYRPFETPGVPNYKEFDMRYIKRPFLP